MLTAVCALIWNDEGNKVLAVSRRGKPEDMGLPGGKVDPGETPEHAIIREVLEETGLQVLSIEKVYSRVCEGADPFFAICYKTCCFGEPEMREEGIHVKWLSKEELLNERNTFAKYNKGLFDYLDRGKNVQA